MYFQKKMDNWLTNIIHPALYMLFSGYGSIIFPGLVFGTQESFFFGLFGMLVQSIGIVHFIEYVQNPDGFIWDSNPSIFLDFNYLDKNTLSEMELKLLFLVSFIKKISECPDLFFLDLFPQIVLTNHTGVLETWYFHGEFFEGSVIKSLFFSYHINKEEKFLFNQFFLEEWLAKLIELKKDNYSCCYYKNVLHLVLYRELAAFFDESSNPTQDVFFLVQYEPFFNFLQEKYAFFGPNALFNKIFNYDSEEELITIKYDKLKEVNDFFFELLLPHFSGYYHKIVLLNYVYDYHILLEKKKENLNSVLFFKFDNNCQNFFNDRFYINEYYNVYDTPVIYKVYNYKNKVNELIFNYGSIFFGDP